MKRSIYFLLLSLVSTAALAQNWVDTLYQYQDTSLVYGQATDFGGALRTLEMDISVPVGDLPPSTGRPLMLLIHGGAFMAGTKDDPGIAAMQRDFAKRGYVTAAINYRLGMFQPASDWHCNISFIQGVEWDCLNQTDTLEWTRAYYRGIQDAHGALRYLVNHAADYNIDPKNVYVVGESAGAFIAMGVGYLDDASETPAGVGAISDAPLPNQRYEAGCLQRYGTGTTNAALVLTRPDLGLVTGDLNLPAATAYQIRGVGDMYGGVFDNLFTVHADDSKIPSLYIFHQPADLIVPHTTNRLFAGYAYCATLFPANCAYILNRPYISGGSGIKDMIDAQAQAGPAPDYLAEFTTNNSDCATQIGNPSLGGHQYDNYWTRTYNMAVFFAPKVSAVSNEMGSTGPQITIAPNPTAGKITIGLLGNGNLEQLEVYDLLGQSVYATKATGKRLELDLSGSLPKGCYLLRINTSTGVTTRPIILQ